MPEELPFTALAAVYDTIMDDVEYDAWADFILSYALDGGLRGRRALDLACGTGGLTRELLAQGLEVTGLDGSAQMLAAARARLPQDVPLVQGNLRSWTLDAQFDLITCVFDSLNNLYTPAELGQALQRAYTHLRPGGLLACDLNTRLGVRELWDGGEIEGVIPAEDGSEVYYHWTHTYDEAAELGVVHALCRVTGADGRSEEFIELHRERGYDPSEVEQLLAQAGFARWDIAEYPDYAEPDEDTPRIWVFAWRGEEEQ